MSEQQALGQLQAQTVQQAAPLLYNQVGNLLKGQPETTKVAVHALIGGVVAKALGGEFGTGMAGTAAGVAAIAVLNENLGSLGLSAQDRNGLLQAVGTIVAGVVAGGEGEGGAAAGTVGMADAYNRQLHPDEQARAVELAAKSGGRFTPEEVKNALRIAGVKGTGVKPDTAETIVDVRLPGAIYDGANMTVSGVSAVEQLPTVDPAVIAYVKEMTGGESSNYYWSESATTPKPALTTRPDYGPQYYTCASSECLLYSANRNPRNPINIAQDKRQAEMIYAAGTIVAGPLLMTPQGQSVMFANSWAGLIGGAMNAGAQAASGGVANINYGEVGTAIVTGYFGSAAQAGLFARYGAGWLTHLGAAGGAAAINASAGAIADGSNSSIPKTIGVTLGSYLPGAVIGKYSPVAGNVVGSGTQEALDRLLAPKTQP